MPSPEPSARRPLETRQSKLFQRLATWLAQNGVTPNAISFASMIFACAAGAALAATSHVWVVAGGRADSATSELLLKFTLHDTYYMTSPAVTFSGTAFVLLAIIAGCVVTAIRRLLKAAEYLRSKARS